ncbi:MAG TPA: hypothetical protein VNA88_04945 [Candidatus Kapabacteria bacterium]|jgi:hypothetical protein|nr:hypothetical protein [Candidatus Kapabacteria bacterium]
MNRTYTGVVVAERPAIGNRPLLRFCPVGEPDRRLRLTHLDSGEIGLLAEEELDLTAYIGMTISVHGRAGRNWIYGVREVRTDASRTVAEPEPLERSGARKEILA